jgi:hypothetical protein
MDPDGGNVTHLPGVGGSHPDCSPDGKKIASLTRGRSGQEFFVMNADGSNVKRLTPNDGGQHRVNDPAWSPDSKRIAYSDFDPTYAEIFSVNADGSDHKRLTKLGGLNLQASWSPDGKKVAFQHMVSGKSVPNSTTVYVMDSDGRNQKEVYRFPQQMFSRLTWRPTKAKQAAGGKPQQSAGKVKPAGTPLELRLRAVKDTYPLDLRGSTADEFHTLLRQAARGERTPPPPPAVDLTLELVNTGTNDLVVWVGGDAVRIDLDLKGPDAVTQNLDTIFGSDIRPPVPTILQPGGSYRFKVTRLAHGYRGRAFASYWLAAGEYTLTARLSTAGSPAPRGAQPSALDRRFGQVELTSNPVRVTVVSGDAPPG